MPSHSFTFEARMHLPASLHLAYASVVTSVRSMQNEDSFTWCAGFSWGRSVASFEPMKNDPPGMKTIPSGQAGADGGGATGAGSWELAFAEAPPLAPGE